MKIRSLRWGLALVVPLTLTAACGDDDNPSSASTTAAAGGDGTTTTGADGATTTSGGGGDVVAVDLRLGAPADCPENPFCIPGLQDKYGIDLSEGFEALEGDAIPAALASGDIDIALMFSTDPQIQENEFVILEDDQGMFSADNIVPALTSDLNDVEGVSDILDALSATLTTENVTAMNAQSVIDHEDADAIAEAFIGENASDACTGEAPADAPPIVVGAQDFPESQIMAELYAQCLSAAGFDATTQELGGFRDLELAAFDSGDINLAPEYAASMLEFINENAGEATADAQETTDALNERLADLGLVALTPSDAVDTNSFVVTSEAADANGWRTISDLKG
jgi:osmoprotectant transport system substrate-binding protein